MSYKVKLLVFEHGEWVNLDGLRIVAVLKRSMAAAHSDGDKWYVTALVEQP